MLSAATFTVSLLYLIWPSYLILKGDFVCVCPCGYEYIESTETCVDIDECASGSHACDDSQDCFNQDGFHECACRAEDCGVVLANKRIEMRLPCIKPEPYNP
jgi:hypothetical protein